MGGRGAGGVGRGLDGRGADLQHAVGVGQKKVREGGVGDELAPGFRLHRRGRGDALVGLINQGAVHGEHPDVGHIKPGETLAEVDVGPREVGRGDKRGHFVPSGIILRKLAEAGPVEFEPAFESAGGVALGGGEGFGELFFLKEPEAGEAAEEDEQEHSEQEGETQFDAHVVCTEG